MNGTIQIILSSIWFCKLLHVRNINMFNRRFQNETTLHYFFFLYIYSLLRRILRQKSYNWLQVISHSSAVHYQYPYFFIKNVTCLWLSFSNNLIKLNQLDNYFLLAGSTQIIVKQLLSNSCQATVGPIVRTCCRAVL